jgi:hypothetical protein
MEWYFWLLIGYGVLIFINTMVGYIKETKRKKLSDIFRIFIVFFIGLFIAPFLWLVSWYVFVIYDTHSYKTFTIHELTEENKVTLRELGFKEGEFISNNNIDYKGFRYGYGLIGVQYNGRVFIKYLYRMSKEQKHLMQQIKNLPKPINVEEKVEDLKKQIKEKKEIQKTWGKWYQKDIVELERQIDELKQNEKGDK